MVRVASLKDMVNAGYDKKDIAGMTPKEQLKQITKQTHDLVEEQYRIPGNKDIEVEFIM